MLVEKVAFEKNLDTFTKSFAFKRALEMNFRNSKQVKEGGLSSLLTPMPKSVNIWQGKGNVRIEWNIQGKQ